MTSVDAVLAAWRPIVPLLHHRGVPALLDPEALLLGGHVCFLIPDEDRRYCVFLGSSATTDFAAPWLTVHRRWVGGYRWTIHGVGDQASAFRRSRWEVVRVADPDWDDSVADAVASCWRTLRSRPCTEPDPL